MADVVFTNVRILDGTGQNPYNGSVLVRGNRIRQVGRSSAPIAPGEPAPRDPAVRLEAEPALATDREHGVGVTLVEQRERVLYPLIARESLELRDLHRLRELLRGEV